MVFVPEADALRIRAPQGIEYQSRDQRTTVYSNRLRAQILTGAFSILDPDLVLDSDPDAYTKMLSELGLMAKIRKRATKTSAAEWLFQTRNPELEGLLDLFNTSFGYIKGFNRSRRNIAIAAIMKGWGIGRIFGRFVNKKMPGDTKERRWWVPTRVVDVGKERWRIEEKGRYEEGTAAPTFGWSIQDLVTQRWHPIDLPGSPPGLRRIDYCFARQTDAEEDLGYSHGIGRSLYSKWYMSTYAWVYALQGAESWAQGKIVIKTPNTFGGATLPGDLKSQRAAQTIRDELADNAAKQLARHVMVLDSQQDFNVFGNAQTGHESVKWIIKQIDREADEAILGVKADDRDKKIDVDPEIVNDDKSMIEDSVEDIKTAFLRWNKHNFAAMGLEMQDLEDIRFRIKRDSGLDPETIGKNMMIAAALGAPVHRDDVYRGLGLTKVDPGSPDAVYMPPPGSPVAGTKADTKELGSAEKAPGRPKNVPQTPKARPEISKPIASAGSPGVPVGAGRPM